MSELSNDITEYMNKMRDEMVKIPLMRILFPLK